MMQYTILMLLVFVQVCCCWGCFTEEKEALLSFKASINETQNAHLVLPSWIQSSDCCKWERVICSSRTGRIVELRLRNFRLISGDFRNWFIDITMFIPFKHLQVLDLSYNSFYTKITPGCERLASLENLNFLFLDYNNFNSSIFPCIAAFPSLKNLTLAYNGEMGSFPYTEINQWKQLEHLDMSSNKFSGRVSFKEVKLKQLKLLNLGGTFFSQLRSIEVMTSLKALSLSNNMFNDSSILEGICSINNVEELDLSGNGFNGNVPLCFSNLASLRVLDMSNNHFSGIMPPLVITSLIQLEYLSLSNNQFEGSFSFSGFANHSNLQVLTLSHGLEVHFDSPHLPPPFQLRVLELGGCNLNSTDFLYNQKELRIVDLSSNKLAGTIPLWLLENNTNLEVLELGNNSFTGQMSLVDGTLNRHLVRLDISNNKVGGQLPQHIGLIFPILTYLNFSRNLFEGSIPESLGNMTDAVSVDLSHNNFSGQVPWHQIGTACVHLVNLVLSYNSLQGSFPTSSINLTSLEVLYIDNNNFSGNISPGLSRSISLQYLDLSNNEFQGHIPSWLANLSSLKTLDMSRNQLKGSIPLWTCQLTMLGFLDLSENFLNGSIPSCSGFSSLKFIHLQKNQITGQIPNTLLEQSSGLMTLDLRHNHLSGGIPRNLGALSDLRVLLLGGNNLEGEIPGYICHLKKLTILDVSHNTFSGQIPACLNAISFGRGHFDEDSFHSSDAGFVRSMSLNTYNFSSSLTLYQFVVSDFVVSDVQEEVEFTTKSRINTYAGNILNYMAGLDFSCNALSGEVPEQLGDLSDIRAINLSHNHLQGSIPPTLSMLSLIESLDLSYNNFTGQIPPQLAQLNFLSIFNVSYNNLSGETPDEGQFANFDDSNYRGNPGLCGPSIKRHCGAAAEPPLVYHEDEHGAIDVAAFIWSFFGSFVIAFSAVALTLYLSPQIRKPWFEFIDAHILSKLSHPYKSYI